MVVVFYPHPNHGGNSGEGVDHHADESLVPNARRRSSHHSKNGATARAYAIRVFLFLMFAVKNSMKRVDALSPAAVIVGGSPPDPIRTNCGGGMMLIYLPTASPPVQV